MALVTGITTRQASDALFLLHGRLPYKKEISKSGTEVYWTRDEYIERKLGKIAKRYVEGEINEIEMELDMDAFVRAVDD